MKEMDVTPDEADDGNEYRPKVGSRNTPLRKLGYEDGFLIRLGKFGEDAGFERGDRVIPDTDEGSIILLEVEGDEEPDDARSLKGDVLRVNIPRILLGGLGITPDNYEADVDPVIFEVEAYPDDPEFPSAVVLHPIGFASGVLDEEGRLLPPGQQVPEGAKDVDSEDDEVIDTGLDQDIVELVASNFPVDDTEFRDTLEAVASLKGEAFDTVAAYPPLEGEGRTAFIVDESTWSDIAERDEIDDEMLEAVTFAHRREAQLIIGEEDADSHRGFDDQYEALVLPRK